MPSRKRQRGQASEESRKRIKQEVAGASLIPAMAATESEPKPTNNADLGLGTLTLLHGDIDALRQLVTCKVCERFLYEPYSLSCGHTYCYSCLTNWFSSNRKKTCPNCRSVIVQTPAPCYIVKDMTNIFIKRAELLPDGETTEEHAEWQRQEAAIVLADKENTDSSVGGLFKGCFNMGVRLGPMYDPSDNVHRCPYCNWELEDGSCYRCGPVYTASDDEFDEMEMAYRISHGLGPDNDPNSDFDTDEEMDNITELRRELGAESPPTNLTYNARRQWVADHRDEVQQRERYREQAHEQHDWYDDPTGVWGSEREDESSDEEDDEGSSLNDFIDDDAEDADAGGLASGSSESESILITGHGPRSGPAAASSDGLGHVHVQDLESEEDDTEPTTISGLPRRAGRPNPRRNARPIALSSSEDEDESDATESGAPAANVLLRPTFSVRGGIPVVESDESDSESLPDLHNEVYEHSESLPGLPSSIDEHSDDDDDDVANDHSDEDSEEDIEEYGETDEDGEEDDESELYLEA